MPHKVEEIPFAGAMDLDTPPQVFQKGILSDARNISFRGAPGNKRIEDLLGTRKITNSYLPAIGQNKNIGAFYDDVNHRIIEFNYNANNTHGIYILDTQTLTYQVLCQIGNNTDGDILGFDPNVYIVSVDIIYGDGVAGDVLFFIDSQKRPTKLNIQRYIANIYPLITRDFIDVAKAPPQMPPKCVYENDITLGFNNLTGSLFQFRYRYVYDDNEKSVWGSDGIVPLPNELSINPGVIDPTKNDRIALYVSTGDITVKKIELAVKITSKGATSDWQLLDSLDKTILFIADNTIYRYLFFNNQTLLSVDVKEAVLLFDWVPQTAGCQALLNVSTIAYSDITEGYDVVASDQSFIDNINSLSDNKVLDLSADSIDQTFNSIDPFIFIPFAITIFKTFFTISPDNTQFTYTGAKITGVISINLTGFVSRSGTISILKNGVSIANKNISGRPGGALDPYVCAIQSVLITINPGDIFSVKFQIVGTENTVFIVNPSGNEFTVSNIIYNTSVYADPNGVLFFAVINGIDSGSDGKQITFYFTGTGINDGLGNPTTFDSTYLTSSTTFAIVNMLSGVIPMQATIGLVTSISANIAAMNTAMITIGFSFVSASTNTLTMSYPTDIKLLSTGIKMNYPNIDGTIPFLSYLNRSSEYFGAVYYDGKGRTNGVVTNPSMKVIFPSSPFSSFFSVAPCWAQIQVSHRPPKWAKYWQPVRSNNNFAKLLYWVSDSALIDGNLVTDKTYAYIGIRNISDYNLSIQATEGVVGYSFAPGDRISIYGRYNNQGASIDFAPNLYDYEVLGVSVDPVINGIAKIGSFVKIKYPTEDVGTDIIFDIANTDYQWYKIILYGLATSTAASQTDFFEFGKSYGIGNSGTDQAYHIGLDLTQTPDLVRPAIISITNGDTFFRQRDVIVSTSYDRNSNSQHGYSSRYAVLIVATSTTGIATPNYIIGYVDDRPNGGLTNADSPIYTDSDTGVFKNLSATITYKVRIKAILPVFTSVVSGMDVYFKIVNASGSTAIRVVDIVLMGDITKGYFINVDATVSVPPLSKLYILTGNTTMKVDVHVSPFNLQVFVITSFTIPVFDQSYSDVHDEKTNSNGRPVLIDINAKQTTYNTLFRFSEPYQLGTVINNTNRFYFNNFDEFEKQYGPVMRMKLHDKDLRIFQYRKCGMVGIYAKFIKDNSGTNQLVTSDTIITPNNIQYYAGEFGIGNQPAALVSSSFVDYFPDPVKGYLCRLSKDGIQPISDLYKVQSWAGAKLPPYLASQNTYQYGGYAKILGTFFFKPDKEGEYICSLQKGIYGNVSIGGESLSFDEQDNGFTSKKDFAPDFILCAENKLYSWYGGIAYIHDDATAYNTFYGQHFDSEIEFVFNQGQAIKKEPLSLSYNSPYPQYNINVPQWLGPQMGDVQSSLGQYSNLVTDDFYFHEGMYHGDFRRDNTGQYGVIDGDFLKGQWFKIRLRNSSTSFTFLSSLYLNYSISQRNG